MPGLDFKIYCVAIGWSAGFIDQIISHLGNRVNGDQAISNGPRQEHTNESFFLLGTHVRAKTCWRYFENFKCCKTTHAGYISHYGV